LNDAVRGNGMQGSWQGERMRIHIDGFFRHVFGNDQAGLRRAVRVGPSKRPSAPSQVRNSDPSPLTSIALSA
jgi:hypothetical protein